MSNVLRELRMLAIHVIVWLFSWLSTGPFKIENWALRPHYQGKLSEPKSSWTQFLLVSLDYHSLVRLLSITIHWSGLSWLSATYQASLDCQPPIRLLLINSHLSVFLWLPLADQASFDYQPLIRLLLITSHLSGFSWSLPADQAFIDYQLLAMFLPPILTGKKTMWNMFCFAYQELHGCEDHCSGMIDENCVEMKFVHKQGRFWQKKKLPCFQMCLIRMRELHNADSLTTYPVY